MLSTFTCGRYALPLNHPLIMGVVNLTPDSFSDGGKLTSVQAAVDHALELKAQGAHILDLGAESSRPGAQPVTPEQEQARLLPVLDALRDCGTPISVDTYHPQTMRVALEHGADMINCIAGFRMAGAIEAVAQSNAGLCIMHMQGEPRNMQANPQYSHVTQEVAGFLRDRAQALMSAGVSADRLCIDPGFGFGKTLDHNTQLMQELIQLHALQLPILVGLSRKSSLGLLTGQPVDQRLPASLAAALAAVMRGTQIVRVHDVAATRDALAVWRAWGTTTAT